MKIYNEINLNEFDFWAGAKNHIALFTSDEIDTIQFVLEDLYSDGLEEVELNDLFWFDLDFLADIIGLTEEELYERELWTQ